TVAPAPRLGPHAVSAWAQRNSFRASPLLNLPYTCLPMRRATVPSGGWAVLTPSAPPLPPPPEKLFSAHSWIRQYLPFPTVRQHAVHDDVPLTGSVDSAEA